MTTAALRALALLLLLALPSQAGAAEVIHRFDSVVSVAKDGTLTVSETIRVRAEGRAIKRGIYRDFPLTFRDAEGRSHEVSFHLIDVTRDGRPEPHVTKRQGSILRIYAGKEDVILKPGDYTYVFRYTTGRQVRWFDGKPELNWNVTGNFWNFPILSATYRLTLPDHVRPLRFIAFTGPVGARGTDWRGGIDSDGTLTVTATRPLPPSHGLTVVTEIPAGTVEPPSQADEFYYSLRDNRRWIFGGIGFVLVLAYYLMVWNAVGRDPKRGTIIPLFEPPKNVSAALANYIVHWGLRDKWRAFTAAALSLAVRGLIRFDQQDKTLTLTATDREPPGGDAGLPSGERAIVDWVRSRGGTGIIDQAHSTTVAEVASSFETALDRENKNRFFRRNLGYVLGGLLLTALVIAAELAFGGLGSEDIGLMGAIAFGGVFLGAFLLPVLAALLSVRSFPSLVRAAIVLIALLTFAGVGTNIIHAAAPGGLSAIGAAVLSLGGTYPFPFVLVGTFAALNGLFLYLMRAPTAFGRPVMDQLAGLKLYLDTAESDRLNMQAPEITADRFEALLPYAVALDVEKPWAEAFAAALKRAHPGDADAASHYRPAWGSGWSGGNLGSAVSSSVSSAGSALASAMPVSSGSSGFSSGGGGSGGGGGGGGGGGW